MFKIYWLSIVATLTLSGCATPSAISIYERSRITAQAEVTAEVNAEDIQRYILANEEGRLRTAIATKEQEYRLRLSVARSAEEGASLALQYATGLEASRSDFLREVDRQLVMVERQRLTGQAVKAVNMMADKEATAARRAFDEFVRTELPRIMEEARAGLAEVAAHNERERLRREQERAAREAERKAREQEEHHHEPEPEPEQPVKPPPPTPTPIEET